MLHQLYQPGASLDLFLFRKWEGEQHQKGDSEAGKPIRKDMDHFTQHGISEKELRWQPMRAYYP